MAVRKAAQLAKRAKNKPPSPAKPTRAKKKAAGEALNKLVHVVPVPAPVPVAPVEESPQEAYAAPVAPGPRAPEPKAQAKLRGLLESVLAVMAGVSGGDAHKRDLRDGLTIMAAACGVPGLAPAADAPSFEDAIEQFNEAKSMAEGRLPERRDWAFQNGEALARTGLWDLRSFARPNTIKAGR